MVNDFSENRAVYEIMGEKFRTGHVIDNNTIRRMRSACWINKAKDTHSEYVIRIALPRQQLREIFPVLLYTHLYKYDCYATPS
jgi:hypothetical protein